MSTSMEIGNQECEARAPDLQAGPRIQIQGVRLDNLSMSDAVGAILQRLETPEPSQVCFVNAESVNVARRDRKYAAVLQEADLALADGVGLKLAGLFEGVRVQENVNGTDLFPRLCAALSGTGKKIYLLGARPGVAQVVGDWVAREYPGVVVCGCRHGYFLPEEEAAVIAQIAESKADLLLVAFGVPRQDLWIGRHLGSLGVKVAVGVGGLFDFYSGRIPRAPLWMRSAGVEWLWRLYQEPRRLSRRYLVGGARFMIRAAAEGGKRLVERATGASSRPARRDSR